MRRRLRKASALRPLEQRAASPASCGATIQVAALERGPADGREGAAWTASSLAADPANIGAFVQADAVPRLLQMLKTGAHLPKAWLAAWC